MSSAEQVVGDAVDSIRETRERMRAMRKRLEAELELDPAVHLAGPAPEEVQRIEEELDPPPEPAGGGWWSEQFERNWPEGQKRTRWVPWRARR